jgi:hypothetical protein
MNLHRRPLYDILKDAAAQGIVADLRNLNPATKRMIVHTHVLAADYRQRTGVADIANAFAVYSKLLSHPELAEELLWQWPAFRRLIWARGVPGDHLPSEGFRLSLK